LYQGALQFGFTDVAKYLQQVGAVVSLDKGEAGKQGRDAIAKVP